jgi:hypothetical protein
MRPSLKRTCTAYRKWRDNLDARADGRVGLIHFGKIHPIGKLKAGNGSGVVLHLQVSL